MKNDFFAELKPKIQELENHPLYNQVNSIERLRIFMQHHVYAVFDFMSLTKSLQMIFAPSCKVWLPPKSNELSRFINEIVLCEESDETPDGQYMSHFEIYCKAMAEVKANSDKPMSFVEKVAEKDINSALEQFDVPACALEFMQSTFETINNGGVHELAASFCYGREKIIPVMFQSLADRMNISPKEAPMFHFYLNRHIEVDGDSHGPLAMKMLEVLCEDDQQKWQEARSAALSAMEARIKFWDQVLVSINE